MSDGTGRLHAPGMAGSLFSLQTLLIILAAGVVGEIIVEFIAWVIAPPLLGRPIEPAVLVQNLARVQLGIEVSKTFGFIVHVAAGAFFMVVGYIFFADALKLKSPVVLGVLWGLTLWATAQGFFAPLAGRPFFLGFIPYTWWSSLMHSLYGVGIALTLEYLGRKYQVEDTKRLINSRLLVGGGLLFVVVVAATNFTKAPPVSFINVGGYWTAAGAGPHTGCLRLRQDGAGVTFTGYLSKAALDGNTADFSGKAAGKSVTLSFAGPGFQGDIVLTLGQDGVLAGERPATSADTGAAADPWRLSRSETACM